MQKGVLLGEAELSRRQSFRDVIRAGAPPRVQPKAPLSCPGPLLTEREDAEDGVADAE